MPRVRKEETTEKEVYKKKRRAGGYFSKTISVVVNGEIYTVLCQVPNELYDSVSEIGSNEVIDKTDSRYCLARTICKNYKKIVL